MIPNLGVTIRWFMIAPAPFVVALCCASALRAQRLDTSLSQICLAAASESDTAARTPGAAGLPDTSVKHSSRPRAIEHSDWYYRRLTVHRIASYPEIPLMATEYVLGEQLLHDEQYGRPPSGLKTAHVIVAGGLGVLFGGNTITGVWNLWDSRHDETGRTRRLMHSILMLTADAGGVAAGDLGGSAKHSLASANLHRTVAISAMGVATAGTFLMWFIRN
jgi:hypothetical protein